MSERIFEEVAVIIKPKYTVRILEYKETGKEYTEISVYSKEATERNIEMSDNFEFSFTVKGKGDEEKEKIEKMTEKEFEEFINHMTLFLEKKYNIVRGKEEKKDIKKEIKKENKADREEDKKPLEDNDDSPLDIDWNLPQNGPEDQIL